jgi:hypothetical protein
MYSSFCFCIASFFSSKETICFSTFSNASTLSSSIFLLKYALKVVVSCVSSIFFNLGISKAISLCQHTKWKFTDVFAYIFIALKIPRNSVKLNSSMKQMGIRSKITQKLLRGRSKCSFSSPRTKKQ